MKRKIKWVAAGLLAGGMVAITCVLAGCGTTHAERVAIAREAVREAITLLTNGTVSAVTSNIHELRTNDK